MLHRRASPVIMRLMGQAAAVHLSPLEKSHRPWLTMGVANELGSDLVVRITVDVTKPDADFLQALADYRNAMAKEQGKANKQIKLRKKRSRKIEAEAALAIQCSVMREQLREMTDANGPLPVPPADEEDKKAREKYEREIANYVSRVIAWDKRNT